MKNAARKSINADHGSFIQLVRAHHKVKQCFSKQQHNNCMIKDEREFIRNPWLYAKKKLRTTKDSVEPLFSVSEAAEYFTQTYSNNNSQYCNLPSWIIDTLHCTESILLEVLCHFFYSDQFTIAVVFNC